MSEIINVKQELAKPQLLSILSASVYNPTPERLLARAKNYQGDKGINAYALKKDGQYIGIVIFSTKNDITEVHDISVKSTCKYLGYGRQLIEYIKCNCCKTKIIAETDDDAVGFYLHCGFNITETYTIQNTKRYVCQFDCITPVVSHYDRLIDENNDPVYDPEPLQEYMDKWDGQAFIDELQLSPEKSVLEIGVGTGRLAVKVAPKCDSFTGIDISQKTVTRAKENLTQNNNITLICDNFMLHKFDGKFDVIYSSLTFMHIPDKLTAMNKIAGLLAPGGRFVLSIDKNQDDYIEFTDRKIKVYPDNPDDICGYIKATRLKLKNQFETEFAYIFVAEK